MASKYRVVGENHIASCTVAATGLSCLSGHHTNVRDRKNQGEREKYERVGCPQSHFVVVIRKEIHPGTKQLRAVSRSTVRHRIDDIVRLQRVNRGNREYDQRGLPKQRKGNIPKSLQRA